MILLAAGAFAADCPNRVSTTELDGLLGEARRSLERLDTALFAETTDALDAALPCLGEPLTRHLAAEVHRTRGIREVSERNPDAARTFAAARTIEPAYKFPSTLIPEGNPVRVEYASFNLRDGRFAPLPPASEGTLTLDGMSNNYRPIDWPTVAQYLGPDGAVEWTIYVGPGTSLPPYPAAAAVVETTVNPLLIGPTSTTPLETKKVDARVPLGVAAGTSLVLTGVLTALAGSAAAQFDDPLTPDTELDAARSRANAFTIASGFTGAATVGFGVAILAVK